MALPVTKIVLDGEAVAHCPNGLPDFRALLGRQGAARACLYAFDLLHPDGDNLRVLELSERRALLRKSQARRAGAALQRPLKPHDAGVVEHRLAGGALEVLREAQRRAGA